MTLINFRTDVSKSHDSNDVVMEVSAYVCWFHRIWSLDWNLAKQYIKQKLIRISLTFQLVSFTIPVYWECCPFRRNGKVLEDSIFFSGRLTDTRMVHADSHWICTHKYIYI